MMFRIISTNDHKDWLYFQKRSGAYDIYYLPEYHQLYSSCESECIAYVAEIGDELLFYPFILKPIRRIGMIDIDPGWYDIETVYGYTGPIATSSAADFLAEAWRGFDGWCRQHRVVSEFIRCSPLLQSERFAAPGTEITRDRETVVISLAEGVDRLWEAYEPVQRNRVRKAIRSGLICEEVDLETGVSVFRQLYEETMRRLDASDFYFFPESYYTAIRDRLCANTRSFIVSHGDKPIAAALFFTYGKTVHYHLGGSSVEGQHLAPNNLLFHAVALWAQRHGFKRLHLGGGRSAAPDDPLLRFKRRFSPCLLPFFLGRRIHDGSQYAALCGLWCHQFPHLPVQSYFPPYRSKPPRLGENS